MPAASRMSLPVLQPWLRLLGLLALLSAFTSPAWALHRCEDAYGRTIFQDLPCAPGTQERTAPQARPASPPTASQATTPSKGPLSEMTVDQFMRMPISTPEDPACVQAYDAALIRQYERHGLQALSAEDRTRLAQMRQACPELSGQPQASPEEQARKAQERKVIRQREQALVARQIEKIQAECPHKPSASERERCAADLQRLRAHHERQTLDME